MIMLETPIIIDISLAVIFLIIMLVFLYRNKQNVSFEKMLFPFFYSFLYRGKFGIKWMENNVKKFKEFWKLYGLVGIGVGFIGMLFAFILIIYMTYSLIFKPQEQAVAPFLPFTSVPGLGYITFSHWIIAIFIIVVIHEASHALVALAHDLKIKNTGFGVFAIFVPFLPAAFVEPDEKELKKASDVAQYSIYAAGPFSNFLLMIPIFLLVAFLIPPVEMGIFTQEGFSFDPIIDANNYPASLINMTPGLTFNRFNNETFDSIVGPYEIMTSMVPNQTVNFGYYNETSHKYDYFYEVITTEHPNNGQQGFLGINNLRTVFVPKPGFSILSEVLSWFKGLLQILFTVTFAIGLINLFPAGMLDGGRMFNLALSKLVKDKKKVEKLASFLALFFWIVILFGFVTYFTGNPFKAFLP